MQRSRKPLPSGFGVVEALLKRDYGVVANSRNITKGNPFAASANLALVDGDMSTRWHAQNLFESLTFTSRYMYRLAAEIHQIRRIWTAPGEPSAISTTGRHGAKDES